MNANGQLFIVTEWQPWLQGCLAALLVVLAGCGGSSATTTTAPSSTSTTAPTATTDQPTTTSAPTPAVINVQNEIDWFIAILNGAELTATAYESRFTDEFRQQVPLADGLQPVLDQVRPLGPFSVVERTGEGAQGEVIVESGDGVTFRIQAEIDEASRFSTLFIQPTEQPSLENPPDTTDAAFSRLSEMGVLRAVVAEIVDGECQPIDGVKADEPAPIGSVFKLYVLAALGEAIRDGEVEWDDQIEIRNELKSVPTGVLQDRPQGATVSVREAAELMISISDNTATDHLVNLLGRETVESILSTYGNSNPELNTPLLDTKEFTALKVGPASGLSTQWLDGDEEARRRILTQISDITPADLPVQEWTEPVQPDELEWFASPRDLCTLGAHLLDLASVVSEIGDILALNPGVPADPGVWETMWFKGGSEPGLAAAWFLTTTHGRTFVTTGSVVNPDTLVDTDQAVLLLAAVRDLVSP